VDANLSDWIPPVVLVAIWVGLRLRGTRRFRLWFALLAPGLDLQRPALAKRDSARTGSQPRQVPHAVRSPPTLSRTHFSSSSRVPHTFLEVLVQPSPVGG